MTTMILLTAGQAAAVAGPSGTRPTMARLDPIALTDGSFYLPVHVLSDTDHEEHWAYLEGLPQVDYAEIVALVPPAKS
jgi:hypothetical protein